ncbi:regulating synaptic membrane exocytosis protein 2-like isoform X2 [Bolinopsis microptera]|uniref:regulating synaptic membrane exocytosis protein 2-like isoform X2 n=1 Tax=Bolinopsis microptera TaxID=2820187 RepID=UPI0030794BCF
MNPNEKALSNKRKAKRVNSEPDALSALRTKERMATSLSEGSNQESDSQNPGIMTRIKGLKSDIMKRVSRVMSDEDMRNLRTIRSKLSHIEEPQNSAAVQEVQDPNQKQKKSDQSLHDVYKQLYIRQITSVAPPTNASHVLKVTDEQLTDVKRKAFEVPKTRITDNPTKADTVNTDESECEISQVLQALKEGKAANEITCSRNIVQRTVTLERLKDFPIQREEQGGQFGLRIVGGKKMAGGTLCAFIASITPGSAASRSPDLHEGDLVLRWNATMLIGLTYEECQALLDDCHSVDLVVSNFLRGSYRRYRPRSSNTSRTGSVESILRGTTNKWITLTRRGIHARQSDTSRTTDDSNTIEESTEDETSGLSKADQTSKMKLEMRLVHVAMENRLSVHLIQAANIPYRDGIEGIDIFCKLYLLPDISMSADAKKRSKTAVRTYNPYWNQHFEYQPILETELSDKKLEVTLMMHHWLQKDQPLGQVEIKLGDRKVLSGQADWFYLQAAPTDSLTPTSSDRKEQPEGSSQVGTKSLSEMMREKVPIQHRTTFSTFDCKKEIVPDIRRTASDSTKPAKPPKQKSKQQQTSDEESSDNVFKSAGIHTHLSNIKESDEQRPPIQVRGSPRRRPRVIRNKSTAKEHRKSDGGTYTRQCSNSSNEMITVTSESEINKLRRAGRSNSEDLTATKQHRILPKTPDRAKRGAVMTLPTKRMTSPLLATQAENFSPTRVILTAPSSEECGSSSTDSVSSHLTAIHRPSPEGRPLIGTGEPSSHLGPGQISVAHPVEVQGSLVLTLGIHKMMLTLEVVQANNLPARPNGPAPDTYVKTYIMLDHNRSHKEKTTTVRCNCNPVFNERITYIVNPTNQVIQVMVWDEVGTLRRNVLLGEILIDLDYISTHGPLQGRYKLFPPTFSKPP